MPSAQEVVERMYAAFGRKDESELRELLHPDIEWNQCAGFPGGDRRRGVDDVLEKTFGGLRSEWDDFRAVVEEYHPAGDTVIALGRYTGVHSGTRREMSAVFAHVYDVQDGRIVRYRQFTDTQPMHVAMGAADVAAMSRFDDSLA